MVSVGSSLTSGLGSSFSGMRARTWSMSPAFKSDVTRMTQLLRGLGRQGQEPGEEVPSPGV